MDIEQLRTFVAVGKLRSFRKAAEKLFLTQSAVSARIRQLEEQLGARLFERDRHTTSLSTAGNRFLPYAEEMIAGWERGRQAVRLPELPGGECVIGATDAVWEIFLSRWLGDALEHGPERVFRAEMHAPEQLRQAMVEGMLDIAIMFDPPAHARLIAQPLAEIPFLFVATAPAAGPYISIDWGSDFEPAAQKLVPDAAAGRVHTNVGRIALKLMLASGGSAWMPQPTVQPLIDAGRLKLAHDAVIRRQVYAVIPEHKRHDPETGRLTASIRDAVPNL